MFEKHNQPLAALHIFMRRVFVYFVFGVLLIAFALGVGILGYHFLEGFSWLDSFLNAAMILSTMGPIDPITTVNGKIFAGFYALFSGLIFVFIIGVIFSPAVHRFFHKFHLSA